MRHTVAKVFAAVLFALPGILVQPLSAARYNLDASHSNVTFKVRHLVVSKVQGRFDKFSGSFVHDEKEIKDWSAEASISDPDILGEIEGAGQRNIDNALEKSASRSHYHADSADSGKTRRAPGSAVLHRF